MKIRSSNTANLSCFTKVETIHLELQAASEVRFRMMNGGDIIQSRFAQALKNQPGQSVHMCPYPNHGGRIFQTFEQLYDHGKTEHTADFESLDARQARAKYRELGLKFR